MNNKLINFGLFLVCVGALVTRGHSFVSPRAIINPNSKFADHFDPNHRPNLMDYGINSTIRKLKLMCNLGKQYNDHKMASSY